MVAPTELQTWLEWASARLLAMPGRKIKPSEPHVVWPEYAQDTREIIEFRVGIKLRALAPSADEIPIMDEILLLPNLCEKDLRRRAIRLRSLVNPLNNRHLYPWVEIAERLSVRQYSLKREYAWGLKEILLKAERGALSRLSVFFASEYALSSQSARRA